MKILKVKINDRDFNELLDLVGEYQLPKDKNKLNEIKEFLAFKLIELGLERYEGFSRSEFYKWISDITVKKFKLKEYED